MLFSGSTFAKGVSINPGLWEMIVTVEMAMMPQPQSETSSECMTESELRPEDFNQDKDMSCDINDVDINGQTASWTISCPNPSGPSMTGQWEFTSYGSSITGSGSMSMDMTWKGQRVGDCN
jgi:hypothetical protein